MNYYISGTVEGPHKGSVFVKSTAVDMYSFGMFLWCMFMVYVGTKCPHSDGNTGQVCEGVFQSL